MIGFAASSPAERMVTCCVLPTEWASKRCVCIPWNELQVPYWSGRTFGLPRHRPTIESCYLANAAEFYFAERGDNGGLPVNPAELNPVTVHGLGPTVGIDFPHLLALMKAAVTDHHQVVRSLLHLS